MPKTHDAIDQARELLVALDQQLTAVSADKTAEARDRVATLAFGLTALLDHLGARPADNDQMAPLTDARRLVKLHEQFSGGRDRRLIVAKFATRWFVLAGYRRAPLDTYGVHGPYNHECDARALAVRMHEEATGKVLRPMQQVES